MNRGGASLNWSVVTPWPARGAIAVLQVRGDGIDDLLQSLGAGTCARGALVVRNVAGIDRCILARFDDRTLLIFPHAGKRILELFADELAVRGVVRAEKQSAMELYPEARDETEAKMLATLARAASPLAVDLLLDQPRRWREMARLGEVDEMTARALQRLITPPLIAAVGPPNVGKSSLLNALAGRTLSLVADQPGTTRDHVGATLDLGGLVVRWIDCPGFRESEGDPLQVEAQRLALEVAARADLLLVCGDRAAGFMNPDSLPPGPDRLRVALRADLGLPATWNGDGLAVSVRAGASGGEAGALGPFVLAIRRQLLPETAMSHPGAWRFWDVEIAR